MINDFEPQVNPDHYDFLNYIHKDRYMSYYYQLKYIYTIKPKNILEIGPGNNFLKNNLKNEFIIKTFDFDEKVKPDYIGNVSKIPLPNNFFELVCCFQVLEHLPFEKFEESLNELCRISEKYVLLSLPYSRIDFKFEIKLPLLKKLNVHFTIPKFYRKHMFDGQHYWEIGTKGYQINKIINVLEKHFLVEEINNPYENPYHIFFKLRKK